MFLRKFLIVLGITALLTSSFAGCKTETSKKAVDENKADSTQKSSDGREMVGNMYKTGLPIVKDKVTYKMVTRKRVNNGPYEEMVFFKQLEEKTNVKIEWDAIPEAQYNEKKNLIFASNDLPDAIFGRLSLTNTDIVMYGTQGAFIPLDSLVDKYAPRLKAIFGAKPDFKAIATAPDGKMYSTPFAFELGVAGIADNMFLYKPWLDKLGLKVPATTDEFYNVLKAFKEKDPNGNGKADEIPFTFIFAITQNDIVSLFGSFGRADTSGAVGENLHLVVENGKVVFTADKPEYKEAVKYFSRYFAEGLMDKESFTADKKQFAAKGKTPEVTYGGFVAWNDFDFAAERAKDYIPVAPLAGPGGKRSWGLRPFDGINGTGFSITMKCKNPEILIRWVDEFYDKRTSVEANFGPVGVNLVDKGNNTFDYIPTPQGMTYDEFRFKNAPAGDAPLALFSEDFGKIIPREATAQKKFDDIQKYYKQYATTLYYPPGLMFSLDATKKLQTLKTDLLKFIDEKRAAWLAEGGIDAEWDAYVSKLKQMGLDEYVKIHQDNYDKVMKK